MTIVWVHTCLQPCHCRSDCAPRASERCSGDTGRSRIFLLLLAEKNNDLEMGISQLLELSCMFVLGYFFLKLPNITHVCY